MRKMGQQERMEIVDYITMNGFDSSVYSKNTPENGYMIGRKRVPVDPNVTVDIKRVFRAPDSLHDESGLAKKRLIRSNRSTLLRRPLFFLKNPLKSLCTICL